GNMTRPPYLSVSAPTGIRPSDPTITGTATNADTGNAERLRFSANWEPRGLKSAQAQKLTAKPIVASVNIRAGLPPLAEPFPTGAFVSDVISNYPSSLSTDLSRCQLAHNSPWYGPLT